jgi:hypothetical protein
MPARRRLVASRWWKVGEALVAVGWTPLLGIILLAQIGLWPDPDPNPIGPGLLFFVTAWPAIICLGIGAYRTWRK